MTSFFVIAFLVSNDFFYYSHTDIVFTLGSGKIVLQRQTAHADVS